MKISGISFRRRVCRGIARRLFHGAENNDLADGARNGEFWLIRMLARNHRIKGTGRSWVVVDAGVNVGDYTATVLRLARSDGCEAEVHAFEPSEAARARLLPRFVDEKKLKTIGKALGARSGVAVLHGGADGGTHASLVDRAGAPMVPSSGVKVEVGILRDYMTEAGLDRVDFLKLDIESFELAALRGLGDFLSPKRIGFTQFEYGGTTLDARTSLREIHAFLESRGYRVAKLLLAGLDVRAYAPWMENFHYANYVAFGAEEFA